MGWTKSTLRNGIASQLSILGNIEIQKQLWEGKIPGFVSYYQECLNYLEDYGIPDCLKEFIKNGFITEVEAKHLAVLDELLDNVINVFQEKEPTNVEIWSSKEWQNYSARAKGVLDEHFMQDLKEVGGTHLEWYNNTFSKTNKD